MRVYTTCDCTPAGPIRRRRKRSDIKLALDDVPPPPADDAEGVDDYGSVPGSSELRRFESARELGSLD
jgi:hypothetical protein